MTTAILKDALRLLQANGLPKIRFIVEVGSFAGGSAMVLGRFARSLPKPSPPVLCLDTWLGDLNMALGRIERRTIDKRHGQPTLYHQFLTNIIAANLTHHVLPMMASSFLGAKMLSFLGLQPDLIYLDSAHELRETFFELNIYWPLLAPGGVLIGDDLNWKAVNHDVKLFARVHDLSLGSFDGCHKLNDFANPVGKGGYRTCVWHLTKGVSVTPGTDEADLSRIGLMAPAHPATPAPMAATRKDSSPRARTHGTKTKAPSPKVRTAFVAASAQLRAHTKAVAAWSAPGIKHRSSSS